MVPGALPMVAIVMLPTGGGAGGGGDAGKYQCRHRRMASGNNRCAFAVRGAGYGGGEEGARVGSSSA